MNVGAFLIVWGGLFSGIPFIALVSLLAEGEPFFPVAIFIGIFVAIGVTVFTIGVKMVKKDRYLKKLSKTGKTGIGHYITHSSNVTSNGTPLYYIKFTYKNDNGDVVEVQSQTKYRYDEASYYASLGEFEIKHNNLDAVITEKIDGNKMFEMRKQGMFNSPSIGTFMGQNTQTTIQQPQKEEIFVCDYCGGIQKTPGKCLYCGANVKNKKKH